MKRIGIVLLAVVLFLSVLLLGALASESAEPAAESTAAPETIENAEPGEAILLDGDGEENDSDTNAVVDTVTDTDATNNEGEGAGWQTINGELYYINTKGKAVVGFQPIHGSTYYFDSCGVLQTGWKSIGTGRYYFGDDGVMRTGTVEIDGEPYYFEPDGMLVELGVITHPQDVTATAGETVTLGVAASGAVKSYQWQYSKDGGGTWKNCTSTGYNTDTFRFTMKDTLDGRLYRCRISGSGTTRISDAAAITLFAITSQPADVTAAAGETVTLTVAAGGAASYQWQYSKDGGGSWTDCKSGTYNTDTFSFTMKASLDGRLYRCRVAGAGTALTTNTATITLRTAPALAITKQPENAYGASGKTLTLSVEAVGATGYRWEYSKDGGTTWTTCTSTGSDTASFSFKIKASLSGRQYHCIVTDGSSSVTSDAATVALFAITGQPADVTAAVGTSFSTTVTAVGDGLTYQWYYKNAGAEDFVPVTSIRTATYTAKMRTAWEGRQQYCVVTDQYGNSLSTGTVTFHVGRAAANLTV